MRYLFLAKLRINTESAKKKSEIRIHIVISVDKVYHQMCLSSKRLLCLPSIRMHAGHKVVYSEIGYDNGEKSDDHVPVICFHPPVFDNRGQIL